MQLCKYLTVYNNYKTLLLQKGPFKFCFANKVCFLPLAVTFGIKVLQVFFYFNFMKLTTSQLLRVRDLTDLVCADASISGDHIVITNIFLQLQCFSFSLLLL